MYYLFPTDVSKCAIIATGDATGGTAYPVLSVWRNQGIPANPDMIAIAAGGPSGNTGGLVPQQVPFSVAVYC
jgi:hypothetical protein